MSDYDDMFEFISGLAEQLQALNKEAVQAYTPIVNAILQAGSRDVRNIEHTLDGLLDFCGYEPILQLYKKLCRHYYFINPAATVEYVNAYREMWDSEEKGESSEPVKKGGQKADEEAKKPRGKKSGRV
jgi:hypothetical protein